MHEASLMVNLMRRIGEVAQADRADRVTGVTVWLGALSHMSAEHFSGHFERAAIGTIAEGARLSVTISGDIHHANAQDILLEGVEVEVPDP
ncbi:MAG: hydrogenase/urease maturation nickel metallochaperone HypA [Alphaproteobacteria bacterium]